MGTVTTVMVEIQELTLTQLATLQTQLTGVEGMTANVPPFGGPIGDLPLAKIQIASIAGSWDSESTTLIGTILAAHDGV